MIIKFWNGFPFYSKLVVCIWNLFEWLKLEKKVIKIFSLIKAFKKKESQKEKERRISRPWGFETFELMLFKLLEEDNEYDSDEIRKKKQKCGFAKNNIYDADGLIFLIRKLSGGNLWTHSRIFSFLKTRTDSVTSTQTWASRQRSQF